MGFRKTLTCLVLAGTLGLGLNSNLNSVLAGEIANQRTRHATNINQTIEPKISLEEDYQNCLREMAKSTKFKFNYEIFSRLVENYPNSAEAHLLYGDVLLFVPFDENREKKAIEEYDKAIKINPEYVPAYLNRGLAYFLSMNEPVFLTNISKNNDLPEKIKNFGNLAVKDFDKAASIDPNLFSAYFNKGFVLKSLGKEKEALESFDRAIEIGLKPQKFEDPAVINEGDVEIIGTEDPMMMMSRFRRHELFTKINMIKQGKEAFMLGGSTGFISNENDALAFAYYHKGTIYSSTNQMKYLSALDCFDKAIGLNPDVPQFYYMSSLVYYQTKQMKKVEQTMGMYTDSVERVRNLRP